MAEHRGDAIGSRARVGRVRGKWSERVREVGDVRKTLLRRLFEASRDDLLEARREIVSDRRERRKRLVHDHREQSPEGVGLERRVPSHEAIQDDPERPEVTSTVDRPRIAHLFGRHESRAAEHG